LNPAGFAGRDSDEDIAEMSAHKDLFSTDRTEDGEVVPLPVVRGANLTPPQQAFNRLMAKIEKLTQTLSLRQRLADAHRIRHGARIEPLRQRQMALNREMVLFLHARLQRKGCTRQQRTTMVEILCALAQLLIAQGDEEMRPLHDQHSAQTYADKQQAELAAASEFMEEVLGVPLDGKDGFESMDEMLEKGLRHVQAESEAWEQMQRARRKPGRKQQQIEKAREEAQTTVREIYRKLASSLHPDRERDAAERERKTALMSEVNTAYKRRDLLALLRLQLRVEQIDPGAIGQLSAQKLAAMTSVLKEQAGSLERDLRRTEDEIRMEFGVPANTIINELNLSAHLSVLEYGYENDIRTMQHDLRRIEDDRELKQWLKAQREAMEEPDLSDLMDFMDLPDFGPPVRRWR
jgi:hypothetical protein